VNLYLIKLRYEMERSRKDGAYFREMMPATRRDDSCIILERSFPFSEIKLEQESSNMLSLKNGGNILRRAHAAFLISIAGIITRLRRMAEDEARYGCQRTCRGHSILNNTPTTLIVRTHVRYAEDPNFSRNRVISARKHRGNPCTLCVAAANLSPTRATLRFLSRAYSRRGPSLPP